MHLGRYIDLVHRTEADLVKAFRKVANAHGKEVDVYQTCMLLSSWSQTLATGFDPFREKYKLEKDNEPDRLSKILINDTREGSMALIRDLQDLYLIVSEVQVCCTILKQGGTAIRDKELVEHCETTEHQSKRQLSWLMTRMKSSAPQILVVAE